MNRELFMPFSTALRVATTCLNLSFLPEGKAIIFTFYVSASSGAGEGLKEKHQTVHFLLFHTLAQVGGVKEGKISIALCGIESGFGDYTRIPSWQLIANRSVHLERYMEEKLAQYIADVESDVSGEGLRSRFVFAPHGWPRCINIGIVEETEEGNYKVTFPNSH
ncbi:MAG: hypothetical protein A2849_00340 [Candidatus Taylorbacteria bacterium RIFCSPHIGHO2_01_FULL_51_15]|uniref:Uncharacterized protein n=1 Tax=Candidatus Taylorbacteria bacterium RIFCSPHIGHO2_01_FULL_51_15 TaxID=1802304 RepID=A0A1G2MBN9_9BACT|nr:MAG: hypothetical protein A2849_00340 [Candidatus Taylorbacteria bacterium RIFCSPHIGHO2_01_FULL_51_15]